MRSATESTTGHGAHWDRELSLLGPGLQAVVQWAGLCVDRAKGDLLITSDGRHYVDFQGGSGVNHVGHSHPDVVSAIQEQVSRWMIGGWGSMARLELLEQMRHFLPAALDRVQLYSSGTEAVEAALRLARSYTGRHEVLSFWGGFHGKSLGSLALTSGGPRKGLGPLPSGFHAVPFADPGRCAFGCGSRGCDWRCVQFARDKVWHESAGQLAAIIVEGVQGRAGNVVPPPGYLRQLRALATDLGALLILDESMTGFGRTGRPFAFDHDGIVPDVVIVGKGMGSGYPITGVVAASETMAVGPFSEPSASSSSFGGFPAACAAAAATLRVIHEEGLVARAAERGERLLRSLVDALSGCPVVAEVRGRGLAIGVEIATDPQSGQPAVRGGMRELYTRLLREGLLVMTGGNSLRLYPALTVSDESVDRAIEVIATVLRRCAQEEVVP